jgi:hypothetical protein
MLENGKTVKEADNVQLDLFNGNDGRGTPVIPDGR